MKKFSCTRKSIGNPPLNSDKAFSDSLTLSGINVKSLCIKNSSKEIDLYLYEFNRLSGVVFVVVIIFVASFIRYGLPYESS